MMTDIPKIINKEIIRDPSKEEMILNTEDNKNKIKNINFKS